MTRTLDNVRRRGAPALGPSRVPRGCPPADRGDPARLGADDSADEPGRPASPSNPRRRNTTPPTTAADHGSPGVGLPRSPRFTRTAPPCKPPPDADAPPVADAPPRAPLCSADLAIRRASAVTPGAQVGGYVALPASRAPPGCTSGTASVTNASCRDPAPSNASTPSCHRLLDADLYPGRAAKSSGATRGRRMGWLPFTGPIATTRSSAAASVAGTPRSEMVRRAGEEAVDLA